MRSLLGTEDIVGLDIADDCITAARIGVRRNGGIVLRDAGWVEYAPGASDAEVADAVKSLWQRHKLSTFTVCSCLRSRSMTLKFFSYPALSDGELKAALVLEAEQSLQLPQDKLVVDWRLNPSHADDPQGGSGKVEGILVAVPKQDVDRHLAILEKARLYPVILDVACMAVCNLFLQMKARHRNDEVVGIVHLSQFTADIAILSENGDVYPRTFFGRPGGWEQAMDYLAENLVDELRYYQFKRRRRPVERLIFTGLVPTSDHTPEEGEAGGLPDGVREERLLGVVRRATSLPVECWDPLQALTLKKARLRRAIGQHADIGPQLAVSLGLALRKG